MLEKPGKDIDEDAWKKSLQKQALRHVYQRRPPP